MKSSNEFDDGFLRIDHQGNVLTFRKPIEERIGKKNLEEEEEEE